VAGRRRRRSAAAAQRRGLVAAILVLALSAPAGSWALDASSVPSRPRTSAALLSPYEARLLERINAVRARHGRATLTASRGLTGAAEHHSAKMVARGFFEHEAPGERSFSRRIERFYPSAGFGYWAVGENLAYGVPRLEPPEAVQEWLESPGHRRNMLWPRWREVGIAVVHAASAPGEFGGEPTTVVTVDFGLRVR
jgi:uncharacterized protein YkwD